MSVYHVCNSCAVAILNDDYSGMEDDTDYPRVTTFVETVGNLVDAGMADMPGYWECESCNQVDIGSAHALETL